MAPSVATRCVTRNRCFDYLVPKVVEYTIDSRSAMLTVRATLGGRASQLARRALSARAHGGTFSPALFRNDSTVWSAWLVASSGPQAEVIASQGCDAVVIDCQHGIYTTESMVSMLQAVSAAPAPQPAAIVRVSQCNAAEMTKALDAGAKKKKALP